MRLSLLDKIRLYRLTQNKTMIEKLKSRKLWATVVAGALAILGGQLGIDNELANHLIQLVMVYISGQAVVDAAGSLGAKKNDPAK